jgi:hypothetical protein
MVRCWSGFIRGWGINLHGLFRSWDKGRIGFGGVAKGLDPSVLGLSLSFLIRLFIDTIVKSMTRMASN